MQNEEYYGMPTIEDIALAELQLEDNVDIAQEWNPDLVGAIDYIIPPSFGLAHDIQKWIIATSVKPQPALAFAATVSLLSVLYGRLIRYDGLKGNIMMICLAESGEGKDWNLKVIEKLLGAVNEGFVNRVHGQMASGAALLEAIDDDPNKAIVLALDEIGHYLSGINSAKSNQFSREIMPIITEMYTCSDDTFRGKKTKGNDGRRITSPHLVVYGMTTERQIMDATRTSDLADGSLARYWLIFGNSDVAMQSSRVVDKTPPSAIVDGLKVVVDDLSMQLRKQFTKSNEVCIDIDPSIEWIAYAESMQLRLTTMGHECTGEKALFKPFFYRAAVKVVQVAMLIDTTCQDVAVLKWVESVLLAGQDVFIKKFIHLASDNENEKMVKCVEAAIKTAGVKGITKKSLRTKTRTVPTLTRDYILKDLFDSKTIFIRTLKINGSRQVSEVYFWKK